MTLTWYGLSSFKITNTGGSVTLITDPFSKASGLVSPRGGADLVLISKDEELYNNVDGITGSPLIFRNPGEFDVKGIFVRGIFNADPSPGTIFHIEMDNIKLAFLGAINTKELTETQLEELNGVDVLIVPVGGKNKVCDWESASHIVQQLEPKIVIPCSFKQGGLKFDLDGPEKFVKEMGGKSREEERLTFKSKDLVEDSTEVVMLTPQR